MAAENRVETETASAAAVRLTTERLVLRTFGPEAAERVADYHRTNREHFQQWASPKGEEFFLTETQRVKLEQEMKSMVNGSFLRLWLVDREDEDGEIIGDVSLSNILRGGFLSCFLGYNLSESKQGKGYMTEALQAAIAHAFGTMGLHRLEANIMLENIPSIRLAERLGLQNEGVSHRLLKVRERWEDHVRYVLLNESLEQGSTKSDE
jgi:ribosomal-protein-alanine N-acetyltransferase